LAISIDKGTVAIPELENFDSATSVSVILYHTLYPNISKALTITVNGTTLNTDDATTIGADMSGNYKLVASWVKDGIPHVWNPEPIEFTEDSTRVSATSDNLIDNSVTLLGAVYTINKGIKGDDFTYDDFTPEQLAALKGDSFTYEDFTQEQLASLKGAAGKGITSIARTSGTGAAGTTDTYTIAFSDSTTTTFNVVNGSNGSAGSNGLSAYEIYAQLTTDNPVKAIEEWNDAVNAAMILAEQSSVFENEIVLQESTRHEGQYSGASSGSLQTNAEWSYDELLVSDTDVIYATGATRPSPTALACYYNGNTFISSQFAGSGTVTNHTQQLLTIPAGTTKIRVTGFSTNNQSAGNMPAIYKQTPVVRFYEKSETYTKEEVIEVVDAAVVASNYWSEKTLWWCGTSIPAGTSGLLGDTQGAYPAQVALNLNATVVNKAVGGSMCRVNVRTGDYIGANFKNITSCLSMTKAEIESFITNYATIKSVLTGSAPETLNAEYLARLRAASFEDRLLPYLNGTLPMPDLFIIDHGHNDYKYTLAAGGTDIGLLPTVGNILSGELAEDTYMTANNNANLESFFGSLANIEASKKAIFIASVNRNCFIGAVNFICTLILKYSPRKRITLVSNYENFSDYAPLIPVQKSIAEDWHFPICEVWKYLGFSDHIIPGTQDYWGGAGNDLTALEIYCRDTVHPHLDTTGISNAIYAGVLTEFIKTIR
jgi:hypothetical protein